MTSEYTETNCNVASTDHLKPADILPFVVKMVKWTSPYYGTGTRPNSYKPEVEIQDTDHLRRVLKELREFHDPRVLECFDHLFALKTTVVDEYGCIVNKGQSLWPDGPEYIGVYKLPASVVRMRRGILAYAVGATVRGSYIDHEGVEDGVYRVFISHRTPAKLIDTRLVHILIEGDNP
jgi:hypothetical protein